MESEIDDALRPYGLEDRVTPAQWYRLADHLREPRDRSREDLSKPYAALTDHVAVTNHGNGVGSEGLANFVECFANYAQSRIRGTGAAQYNLDEFGLQRFEQLAGTDLCDELLDELADVISYSSMIAVKVLVIRSRLAQ